MPQNAGGPRYTPPASSGGGSGTVEDVNGDPGPHVVLDASDIPFTPTGTISASDVQAAVAEVATDYLAAIAALSSVYQPLDSDLSAIAALATVAFGRSLLTLADAAALRTLAGLGTIATQNANNVTITGGSITGIPDIKTATRATKIWTRRNSR